MARGPRMVATTAREMHLVVLQHGMWGCPTDVEYVAEALRQAGDGRSMLVLNSDVNVARLTYDGIDVLGDRLASLVISYCSRLASGGLRRVTKISFVAYSLGGLIARYAIGKLASLGFFCTAPPYPGAGYDQKQYILNPRQQGVIPVNYVSFATPHLGSWAPPTTLYRKAFNAVLPYTLSRTGSQLVLADDFKDGKPLLAVMADPQYAFLAGLSLFQKRIALANTRHDATVPFTTASISPFDPYEFEQGTSINPMYPCIVSPVSAPQLTAPPSFVAPSHQLLLAPPAAHHTKSGSCCTGQSPVSSDDDTLVHPDGTNNLSQPGVQTATSSKAVKPHTSTEDVSSTVSPKPRSQRASVPFSFTAGETLRITPRRGNVEIPTPRSISAMQSSTAGCCSNASTAGAGMASSSQAKQVSPNKADATAHVTMPHSQPCGTKHSDPLDIALSLPTIRTSTQGRDTPDVMINNSAAASRSGDAGLSCVDVNGNLAANADSTQTAAVSPSPFTTPPSRKALYQRLRQDRCEADLGEHDEVVIPGTKRRVNRQAGSNDLISSTGSSTLLIPKRLRVAHGCMSPIQAAFPAVAPSAVFPEVVAMREGARRDASTVHCVRNSWRPSSVVTAWLDQFTNREWLRERLHMWHRLCQRQQQAVANSGVQHGPDKQPARKQNNNRSPVKTLTQCQAISPVSGRKAGSIGASIRLTPTRQRRLQGRSDITSPRAMTMLQAQPFLPYLPQPRAVRALEIQPWAPRPSIRKQAPYSMQHSSAYHPTMAAFLQQRDRSKALALPGPSKPRVRATPSMALLQQLSGSSSTVTERPRPAAKLAKDSRLRGEVFVILLPVLVVLWCCMLLWLLALSTRHYMLLVRVKKDRSWDMQWPPKRAQQAAAIADGPTKPNVKIEDITDLPDEQTSQDGSVGNVPKGGIMQQLASFSADPTNVMRAWAQTALTWLWQVMISLVWGSAASWWDVLHEQWEESLATFQPLLGSNNGTAASVLATLFQIVCWIATCACYLPGVGLLMAWAVPQRDETTPNKDIHKAACLSDCADKQQGSTDSPAEACNQEGCPEEDQEPIQATHQRKMCEQLNQLRWHKVDVDTRHFHAHAAIVVRSAARFSSSHGHVVQYAIRQMRDLS